jgi:P4 family phage/plasmid primase-like protien
MTTPNPVAVPVKYDMRGNQPDAVLTPAQVIRDWKKHHLYEVAFTSDDDLAVLYGDIDVEVPATAGLEEYEALNDNHRKAIKQFIGSHPFALASASSFKAKKISWRFYVPDVVGTHTAMREYAERVNQEKGITTPDGSPIKLDLSVYHVGRKMRMLHAWKQTRRLDGQLEDDTSKWENRPLVLVEGEEQDTILHRINENAEVMKSTKSKRIIPLHHDDFDLYRKLVLECWSDERANEFVGWRNAIWAIKSVENTDRGRELAHDFAKKSYKYSQRETDRLWEQGKDKITGKSIHFWARSDNPIRYAELTAKLPIEFLQANILEGDKGLANIFTKAFEGVLVSVKHTPTKTGYWAFKHKEGLWAEVGTDYIITQFTEHMKTILTPLAIKLAKEYKDAADTEEGKLMKKKMDSTLSLITQMTLTKTATKCMPQISTKMGVDKMWEDNLNANPAVLPVKNGVLCLKTGTLRQYELEDYITYKLDVEFDPEANTDKQKEFVSQILHGNKEAEDFFQYFMGYSITGENNRSQMLVEEGTDDGANAKSHFNGCILNVMGNLMTTGDRKSFSVRPDGCVNNDSLYNARFARIVVINELNKKDKLDIGQIKTYTGNEPVTVSAKYKNEVTYTPKFTIIVPLNDMVEIPAEAGAMWRRIIMVQFKVRFLTRDHIDWDEEKFKDGWIVERDDAKGQALKDDKSGWLMWLVKGAMDYYKNPTREAPPSLQEHMIKTQEENDPYLKQIRKDYVFTGDHSHYVIVKELSSSLPKSDNSDAIHAKRIANVMKRLKAKFTSRNIHPNKTTRRYSEESGTWEEVTEPDLSVKAENKKVWTGIRKKTEAEKEAEE